MLLMNLDTIFKSSEKLFIFCLKSLAFKIFPSLLLLRLEIDINIISPSRVIFMEDHPNFVYRLLNGLLTLKIGHVDIFLDGLP